MSEYEERAAYRMSGTVCQPYCTMQSQTNKRDIPAKERFSSSRESFETGANEAYEEGYHEGYAAGYQHPFKEGLYVERKWTEVHDKEKESSNWRLMMYGLALEEGSGVSEPEGRISRGLVSLQGAYELGRRQDYKRGFDAGVTVGYEKGTEAHFMEISGWMLGAGKREKEQEQKQQTATGPHQAGLPPAQHIEASNTSAVTLVGSTDIGDTANTGLPNDIPTWLRSHRLQKYTDGLKDLKWAGLIELDDSALEQRGVTALGARNKLLRLFGQMKRE